MDEGLVWLTISLIIFGDFLLVNGQDFENCEDSQWYYTGQNNLCYILENANSPIDWFGAYSKCQEKGSTLASPSTEGQHRALLDLLKQAKKTNVDVWIGLWNRYSIPNNWQWTDGSWYSFTAWAKQEPNPGERFVRIRNEQWWAINDEVYNHYICQKECLSISRWQYSEATKLCYSLQSSPSAITWHQANRQCEEISGKLASPSTEEDHWAVTNLIRQAGKSQVDVWIGLRHERGAGYDGKSVDKGWKWTDGSSYRFMRWAPGEPGLGEEYGRMRNEMWWAIGDDRGPYYHYICQKGPRGGWNKALLALLVLPILGIMIVLLVYFFKWRKNSDQTQSIRDRFKIGSILKGRNSSSGIDIKVKKTVKKEKIFHIKIGRLRPDSVV